MLSSVPTGCHLHCFVRHCMCVSCNSMPSGSAGQKTCSVCWETAGTLNWKPHLPFQRLHLFVVWHAFELHGTDYSAFVLLLPNVIRYRFFFIMAVYGLDDWGSISDRLLHAEIGCMPPPPPGVYKADTGGSLHRGKRKGMGNCQSPLSVRD
jgi:hypothetical protein